MINNVREQQFETSGQLIANVKKIIKNIDKNITLTRVYLRGEQAENSLKNRPIAASPLDKQQNFSVVRHAHKLKYTGHKNVYTSPKTCAKNGTQHDGLDSYYIM